jgi:DNA-binding CsgD family transcriptional regulator
MAGIALLRPLISLHMPAGRVRAWAEEALEGLESEDQDAPARDGGREALHWGYVSGTDLPAGWPVGKGRWILSSTVGYGRLRLPPGFAPVGFIPALTDTAAAVDALRAINRGYRVFPVDNDASPAGRPSTTGDAGALSPQEHRVLDELARGESNKRIAYLLGLSESTVRFHVGNIFSKLGAQNRAEAVYRAIGRGWLII